MFSLFPFPLRPLRASWGNPRWEEGRTVTTNVGRMCRLGVTRTGTRAGGWDERGRRGGRARAGRALRLRGTVQRPRSLVQPDTAALPSPNVCEVFFETAVSEHLRGPLSLPRHHGKRNLGCSSHLPGWEAQCLEGIPHGVAQNHRIKPIWSQGRDLPVIGRTTSVSFFSFLFICFPDFVFVLPRNCRF